MQKRLKRLSKERGDCNTTILEQWKTCVEMANSIADKRNVSNGIYITINTGILAIMNSEYGNVRLAVVGIIICLLWFFSIRSYVKLSKVKYEIINELEKELPFQPFALEWKKLNSKEKYRQLTWFEKCIPVVFLILFSLSLLVPVIEFFMAITPCLMKNFG